MAVRQFRLGSFAGVEIRFTAQAVVGFALLWLFLAWLGNVWLGWSLQRGIVFGFLGAFVHMLTAVIHHLSHAFAARRTGYPMEAVLLGQSLFFGLSVYPEDEPALPGRTHIMRALGGPIGSFLFAVLAGGLAFLVRDFGGMPYWLAVLAGLDGFLIFFIGVLIPLGFNDMSTIIRWWGK